MISIIWTNNTESNNFIFRIEDGLYIVRDYSDVQRLLCQTSWGRGTSELVLYQKVDICPPKIDALLRRLWCRLTALELYKSGINLFIFHLSLHLCKFHFPANLYFLIIRQFSQWPIDFGIIFFLLTLSNGRQVTREFVVSRLKICKYLYFFTSFIGDRGLTFSSQPRFFTSFTGDRY